MDSSLQIPNRGVKQFVESLAIEHFIYREPSESEKIAQTISSYLGIEGSKDSTSELIIELRRQNKISSQEMSQLLQAYLKEKNALN